MVKLRTDMSIGPVFLRQIFGKLSTVNEEYEYVFEQEKIITSQNKDKLDQH